MREVPLHQLCTIFFEQVKRKAAEVPFEYRTYAEKFQWVHTHSEEERAAAKTEILRRIKRPELDALSDASEDTATS
jgi:hypothetical protein